VRLYCLESNRILNFPTQSNLIIFAHGWLLVFHCVLSLLFRTVDGYPLKIEGTNIVAENSSMDSNLVRKVLPKLNYPGLVAAINDIRNSNNASSNSMSEENKTIFADAPDIPLECPLQQQNSEEEDNNNNNISESVLKALHFFLFDVHVVQGCLICPDTGRRFPIKDGIPNMILHEDEV
jgi:multifunctional methyltransferase subunit TRM112